MRTRILNITLILVVALIATTFLVSRCSSDYVSTTIVSVEKTKLRSHLIDSLKSAQVDLRIQVIDSMIKLEKEKVSEAAYMAKYWRSRADQSMINERNYKFKLDSLAGVYNDSGCAPVIKAYDQYVDTLLSVIHYKDAQIKSIEIVVKGLKIQTDLLQQQNKQLLQKLKIKEELILEQIKMIDLQQKALKRSNSFLVKHSLEIGLLAGSIITLIISP